jgi:anaerobic magnesium-protoporphyrin IX monomethyl ester cyclase
MHEKLKVLLIYPTLFMQTGAPMAIACLSGALKAANIDVKAFSTYAYSPPSGTDEGHLRSEVLFGTLPVDYASKGIVANSTNEFDDIKRLVLEYQPDLVGMTATESIFGRGVALLEAIKSVMDVPTIAGGYFPTLAPEVALAEQAVDMICVGEGESAIVELCNNLERDLPCTDIMGIWAKTDDGTFIPNGKRLEDLESLPVPDFDCFDYGMMLRPMRGNLLYSVPIEFARGCPYQCTFCAAPVMEKMFKGFLEENKGHFRKKSIKSVIEEIERCVKKYNPEFIYFNSETFLVMSNREFDEFVEGYRKFSLPFWIQTRPETITRERIARLKEVGMLWLSIGIEHGDADFRSKILKRHTKTEELLRVIGDLVAGDQGASVNMIIGYPFETRELVYKTIGFAREVYQLNPRCAVTISTFTPYRGCELYDVCVENGFWDGSVPYISETEISVARHLDSDLLSEDDMTGLHRTFPLYVYLPDEYLDRIPLAEQQTAEGDSEYRNLMEVVKNVVSHPKDVDRVGASIPTLGSSALG